MFLTVTSAVCQMASQKWYGLYVFLLTILASGDLGVIAEEEEGATAAGEKPWTSLEEHLLEAYDCDDPEEVTLHSTREQNDQERQVEHGEAKNYTIIKRTETFEYEATLCAVHRTRDYYQCISSAYLGAMAPSVMSREDDRISREQCTSMGATRIFEDGRTGRRLHFDNQSRASHITHTLLGSFHYSDGEASCEGAPGSIGLRKLERMLVTDNLAIRANKVKVRENFETGDIKILELGITIRAPQWRNGSLRTEFGIIARKPQETPCAWNEVQELEAKWTVTSNGAEAALIGDKDQVYITLGDHAPAEAGCPIHYVWMETSDPNTRVVHKLRDGPEREFLKASEEEKKENWDKQFKEDYNLSQLRRAMELKRQGRTIDWLEVEEGRHSGTTAGTAKARWVTVTREDRWITLKCKKERGLTRN